MKRVFSTVAFAASCLVGFVAMTYGVTAALLMGSQAQADVDETTPADPRLLIRTTAQRLIHMAQETHGGTIELEDDAVEINIVE